MQVTAMQSSVHTIVFTLLRYTRYCHSFAMHTYAHAMLPYTFPMQQKILPIYCTRNMQH